MNEQRSTMGFEEEYLKLMIQRAEAFKEYYKKEYGEEDEMSQADRSFYQINYKDSTKVALRRFYDRLNCGGYAFEIDNCFFPNGEGFSNYISSLLETFDFIRLLGDEPLKDDEYLVFYRFMDYEKNGGKNKGHHFIRVNSDGLVVEKNGYGKPMIFTGWHKRYENSPEAVFAVKKRHNHFFDSRKTLTAFSGGLDFPQSVSKAIEERSNSFSYHSHNYQLKKNASGDVVIINKDGEIVAELIDQEGDKPIVRIIEGKEGYVENLSGPVRPIIQNGMLINIEQFRQGRTKDETER